MRGFSDNIANLNTEMKNLESSAARKAEVEQTLSLYTELAAFEELQEKISEMPTMAGVELKTKRLREDIF